MLNYMYSPFTQITYILTFFPISLEHCLRAIWKAIPWVIVFILPQMKLKSQLSCGAYFKVISINPSLPIYPFPLLAPVTINSSSTFVTVSKMMCDCIYCLAKSYIYPGFSASPWEQSPGRSYYCRPSSNVVLGKTLNKMQSQLSYCTFPLE